MKIEVYSPTIRRREMDAVLTAMVEEKIGPGERNQFLIQTAKDYLRFDYALALRSPAVALQLALKALNVKAGQAVIISALSPRYYLQVIEDLFLKPLFCDVSFDFPCMSRETIEKALMKNPGFEACAIILHHALGFIPDTQAINESGLPVIEDISHSYGTLRRDNTNEDEAELSGDKDAKEKGAPIKNRSGGESNQIRQHYGSAFYILGLEERDMLTSGGGALLFAMNKKDGSALRNFAAIPDEFCIPDMNAALAIAQFKDARRNIEKRAAIARIYAQSSLRTRHKMFVPLHDEGYNNYSFPLVLETGLKDVIAYARKKEIVVESAFENTLAGSGVCGQSPVSNSLALRTVSFPIYPRLRSQDAERVAKLIMTLP
ncbi:MAG: DegT/DnrJ/EryC1/StrS family aminotransferase [Treponema sp.]|jgi:dTDP-4-amino-4,6-dideoxygalactose transaminase|nr:DegT/DnrJ/EryC1/StrS family aminotransferase [Treponema sp.]